MIVGWSRLVWLDPEKPKELWSHGAEGGDALVGVPLADGKRVIVTDQAGRYVALNEADGKQQGPGYALRGSVAPASGPVAFGERLLCPLTDGTLMLLDPAQLGAKPPAGVARP